MNPVIKFIERAELKDGTRLPPERELAITLGLSRRELRRHLSEMELDGLVWRGRRTGTIIGPHTVRRAAPSIDRHMDRGSPGDVIQARLALEPPIAALAAVHSTEADLAIIENCLRRGGELGSDEDWVRWDGAFHLAIAKATRNEIFVALVTGFNVLRGKSSWRTMQARTITPEIRRRTIAQHRAVWIALRDRRPEPAEAAMREHLEAIGRNFPA